MVRSLSRDSTKKCSVLLERLDEKALKKCLQRYGLRLYKPKRSVKEQGTKNTVNNCQNYSRSKKTTKTKQKNRSSDDFVLERNYKRKGKVLKPLCYTDDESGDEKSETTTDVTVESQVLPELEASENPLNENITLAKSKPEEVNDKKISVTEMTVGTHREEMTNSPKSEVETESVQKDRGAKNTILPQQKNVWLSRIDQSQVSSAVENEIEIIKVCEKRCDKKESTASLMNEKGELTADSESVKQQEFMDEEYDSREDGEDERNTVIFENDLHKDTDLEEIFEMEEKEMSKKFSNREKTNRKRQWLAKFKRKSMAGRNLAKVERKQKNKLVEGPTSEQEVAEKSIDCVSEECLREVCFLVKRLHELSRIILQLQKELPKNNELSVHFNEVINAQLENFHKEIRKGQKIIIKRYEEMLSFYSDTSQVALEIGKRTSLSVEDVVNVISLCILIEGRCDAEKSLKGGKQGIFEPVRLSEEVQKIISNNLVKILEKRMHQFLLKQNLSGIPKQSSLYDFGKKVCANNCPPSQSNMKQFQTTNGSSFNDGQFTPQAKQQIVNNVTGSPSSQPHIQPSWKKVGSTGSVPRQSNTQQQEEMINNFTNTQTSKLHYSQPVVSSIGPPLPQHMKWKKTFCTNPQSSRQSPKQQKLTHSTGYIFSRSNNQAKHPTDYNSISVPNSGHSIQENHQVVNSTTGFRPSLTNTQTSQQKLNSSSQPSIPLGHFYHRSFDGAAMRVRPVHQSHRLIPPHPGKLIPPARISQDILLTPKDSVSGRSSQRKPIQRILWNSTVQSQMDFTCYTGHCGVVSQRPPLTSSHLNHRGHPQGNVLVSSVNIENSEEINPALVNVIGCNHPSNEIVESDRSPTITAKVVSNSQNGGFPCTITSNGDFMNSSKQIISPSETQCPLKNNNNNNLGVRILNNTRVFTVPMDLSEKDSNTKTEVASCEVQEVLDPTIPQKLTMKNSRLQAGPVLDLETEETKTKKKSPKGARNAPKGINGKSSRVYDCAQNDCKNPGVKICNGCRSIIYCSTACQFAHWMAKHKSECYQLKQLRRYNGSLEE